MKTRGTGKRISLQLKRLLDVVFSAGGLIVLSPLFLVITCVIRLNDPGRAMFRQTRVGFHGEPFTILKYKTISEKSHGNTKNYVPFGKGMRRFKLDELPQLYNILTGDMSFIGPRPYVVKESRNLDSERYLMRPGLTGLAQVYGNRELSWEERTAYDVEYVRNYSLLLDLRILLRTLKIIVLGEKACVKHRT